MKNKKLLIIIIAIILLLLLSGGAIYWFLIRDNNVDNTSSNKPIDDDNITQEFKIPSYKAQDFSEIASQIEKDLKEWSKDYRIHSVTGMTTYTMNGDEKVFYGTEGGKFSSWMIDVYSPSKQASVMYLWDDGVGEIGEEMDISEDGKYIVDMYDNKEVFNDITSLVSTQSIVEEARKNGLDDTTNYIFIYLGESNTMDYGNQYVWKIDERSKTEEDEYSTGLFLNGYVVDAKTGKFISTAEEL